MDYITESAFFAYECQKSNEQVELESYINECLILAERTTESTIDNLASFNEAESKGLFQKIKEALKKFGDFIKRIFAKFSDKASRLFKGNKAWLDKNRETILSKPFKYETVTMPNYFEGIKRMTQAAVPAFSNFENMKPNLVDDKTGYEWMAKSINMTKFTWYNGIDFKLAVKNFFQGGEEQVTFTSKSINLTDIYNYCYTYDKMAANIEKDSKTIERAITTIESIIKQKIDSIESTQTTSSQDNNQSSANQSNNQNNSQSNPQVQTNSAVYSRVYDRFINEVEIGSAQTSDNSNSAKSSNDVQPVISNNKTGVAGDETKTASANMNNIDRNGKTDDDIKTGNVNDVNNAKDKKELEDMNNVCERYRLLASDVFAAKATIMEKCYKDFLKVLIAHVDYYAGKVTKDNKQTDTASDYSNQQQ